MFLLICNCCCWIGAWRRNCRIKEQMETPEEQMKNCQEWLRWNRAKYFYQLLKEDVFGSEIRSWAITPNYAPTWDESFSFVLPASINNKRKEKHNRNFSKYIEQNQRQPYNLQGLEGSPLENKIILDRWEMLHSNFVSQRWMWFVRQKLFFCYCFLGYLLCWWKAKVRPTLKKL